MKIRDLWRRVGESPRAPGGSVLTNRPEVNVPDRPRIAFSRRRILLATRPVLGEKREGGTFDPFSISSYFVSRVPVV